MNHQRSSKTKDKSSKKTSSKDTRDKKSKDTRDKKSKDTRDKPTRNKSTRDIRTHNTPVIKTYLVSDDSLSSSVEEFLKTENSSDIFLFVYEANGTIYKNLNDIDKADGRLVTIHPVYYAEYNNNLSSEDVVYDEKTDKYISSSSDGSWLDIIYNFPDNVLEMDVSEVILYEDKYYHCDGDLLHHLIGDLNIVELH